MSKNELRQLEMELKALANKRRLLILQFLKSKKSATVGVIAEEIKLSFKSTSRHLLILFSVGILEREQRSLEVYYFISKELGECARGIISKL